jgi:hypothetical protein
MVYFDLDPNCPLHPNALAKALYEKYQIQLGPLHGNMFRAVTHYWITPERVYTVLSALKTLLTA